MYFPSSFFRLPSFFLKKKAPRGNAGGAVNVVLLFSMLSDADRPARRGRNRGAGDGGAPMDALKNRA
jgi:hypothetical protein